jgi:hypothetical protein
LVVAYTITITNASPVEHFYDQPSSLLRRRPGTRTGHTRGPGSTEGDRLVSREIITDVERGVLVDRFYAERLYTSEELCQLLTRVGFCLANVHSVLITGSARNQDLGMMARLTLPRNSGHLW